MSMRQPFRKGTLMVQGVLGLVLILGQLTCKKPSLGPPILTGDNTPADWRTKDLATVLPLDGQIEGAKILAWEVVENSKGDRIESCLACLKSSRGGHSYWTFAHFYRWPNMQRSGPGWELSMVFDAPQVPWQEFDHHPTCIEAMKFVSDTWWDITRHPGGNQFTLIARGICPNAWRWATGCVPENLPPPAFGATN